MLSTPKVRAERQDTETTTHSRDRELADQGLCYKTSSQFANGVLRRDATRACTLVLHLLMQKDNSVKQQQQKKNSYVTSMKHLCRDDRDKHTSSNP